MIWRELFLTMFDCWNIFYKLYFVHRSFFYNDWLILRQLWSSFSVRRDAWALCLRFLNTFFYFSWNSLSSLWHFHFFRFHQNKFFIEDLMCSCRKLAMLLFCQLRWSFLKDLFMTRRCKIDWILFSFFLNVFAFNVFSLAVKSFIILTFIFFLTSDFFWFVASLF